MDRVKAAIFSSLSAMVPGARVLDLFAGSGALGIEALSRGAAEATFVESEARAVEAIRRNLETTLLKGVVHQLDVFAFLDRLARPGTFEMVLADPPYAKQRGERSFTPELLASEALHDALSPDGIFVLEKMPVERLPSSPRWEPIRSKTYGATEVVFLRAI
jgi:16S rRNA (guanine966-N2)-methyltransferase